MNKIFTLEGDTIMVDDSQIDYGRLEKYDEARDLFFKALSGYSGNTEMMMTFMRGTYSEKGGMVAIPWNILATLIHCLMMEMENKNKPWYEKFYNSSRRLLNTLVVKDKRDSQ